MVGIQHLHRLVVQLFSQGAEALPHIPLGLLVQFEAHIILDNRLVLDRHVCCQQSVLRLLYHVLYIQFGRQTGAAV